MCQMNSSMQLIWITMPAQRQICKEPWIKCHSHVTTMTSHSAQKDVVQKTAPKKPYDEPIITVNGQKTERC